MAQAIADPEELLAFAANLEQYLNTLEEETGRLKSHFNQLGDSWQDQQRASFEDTFEQLLNTIQNFKENASEQIPHLRILAEDLNTYLRR